MLLKRKYAQIFLDIDGVIRNVQKEIERVIFEKYKVKIENPDSYELSTQFPSLGKEVYDIIFKENVEEIYGDAEPMVGAIEKIFELHDIISYRFNPNRYGVKIFYLTRQNEQRASITNAWLDKYEIKNLFPVVYVGEEFKYQEKSQVIEKSIKMTGKKCLFIDDSVDELNKVNEINDKEYVDCVCLTQPYNLNWKGYRIDSIDKLQIDRNDMSVVLDLTNKGR